MSLPHHGFDRMQVVHRRSTSRFEAFAAIGWAESHFLVWPGRTERTAAARPSFVAKYPFREMPNSRHPSRVVSDSTRRMPDYVPRSSSRGRRAPGVNHIAPITDALHSATGGTGLRPAEPNPIPERKCRPRSTEGTLFPQRMSRTQCANGGRWSRFRRHERLNPGGTVPDCSLDRSAPLSSQLSRPAFMGSAHSSRAGSR